MIRLNIIESILIFSLLFIFIPSCSDTNVLNEDTFVEVYANLIIAQDTLANRKDDLNKMQQGILKKYNVSEEDYFTTIEYYNSEPELWESFFDKAIMYVEKLRKKKES